VQTYIGIKIVITAGIHFLCPHNLDPDLLVEGVNSNYIIEVKPAGKSSSKVHDGLPQLVNYWEQYESDEMEFSIRGKNVDIDAFLLATDFSPQGRLYTGSGERDVMRKFIDGNRKAAINSGQLPEREFNATESIIRTMWRFSKERKPDAKTGVGALLSSRLDGTDAGVDNSNPAALYKSHGGIELTKEHTGYQFWEYIPFDA